MNDDPDSYPDVWKHPATRRREHEAGRESRGRQQFIDDTAASRALIPETNIATSGAGGHLGPSPLANDNSYPSDWRRPRRDNKENEQ